LLKEFLTNSGQPNNFKAKEFVADYKQTVPQDVLNLLNKMNEQVFHAAKRRPSEAPGKVTSRDLVKIFQWLDAAMKDFVGKLPLQFREYWQPLPEPVVNFSPDTPPTPSTSVASVTMTSMPPNYDR